MIRVMIRKPAVLREDVKQLLEKIQSPDGAVRQAAWKSAGPVGAAAVVPLGELAASSQKPVARAAAFALDRIAHYAARPGSNGAAHAVAIELLNVAGNAERPYMVRSQALNLLGMIADSRNVPGIAALLNNKEMRQDARMALERIPGSAATNALKKALAEGRMEERAGLEHSLHARSLTGRTVGVTPAR